MTPAIERENAHQLRRRRASLLRPVIGARPVALPEANAVIAAWTLPFATLAPLRVPLAEGARILS